MIETFLASMEIKLAPGDGTGEVSGYGAVFGNQDSHGDVILPGAFAHALAGHKAAGTMPALYVEHGPVLGGSLLPDGVWTHMEEDATGLKVRGRISALDTDHGKRIRSLVQDGALSGMSIGFKVGAGNATVGKKAGEPRRTISSFDKLYEVSLVNSPSNTLARVDGIKGLLALADKDAALGAVVSAIALHAQSMSGGDSSAANAARFRETAEERAQMLTHLQDAHHALSGSRMPAGLKAAPTTIREMETALRELGFSRSQATDIATRGFKATQTRDGDAEPGANPPGFAEAALRAGLVAEAKAALCAEIGDLSGFTLPKF